MSHTLTVQVYQLNTLHPTPNPSSSSVKYFTSNTWDWQFLCTPTWSHWYKIQMLQITCIQVSVPISEFQSLGAQADMRFWWRENAYSEIPLSPDTQHTHNWGRTSRLSHSTSSLLPGNSSCPRNLTLFNRFQTRGWRTSWLWSWVEAESTSIVQMQSLVPGLRQKSKKSTQLCIVQSVILSMDS